MVDFSAVSTEADMANDQPFRILYVCSGNAGCSALAEAFASAFVSQNGHKVRWEVSSASLDAVDGQPVMPEIARVASTFGFDLSPWRARTFTAERCTSVDLILAMSWDQVSRIWSEVPGVWERSFTLREFVHYAKRAPTTPPIMFPDKGSLMRDKVKQSHGLRKRVRSDLGFWGGLRPQELSVDEPPHANEPALARLAQTIRALVTDSIRLVGGP